MKHAEIYTDGSYCNNSVGYGAVILHDGEIVQTLSGRLGDFSYLRHRQVGGELQAVLEAVLWCRNNGYSSATVHYDYLGVQCWAEGSWKTKTELTRQYAARIREHTPLLTWKKVKAHSGNRYNEMADSLAKQGCGAGNGSSTLSEQLSPAEDHPSELQEEAERAATDIMTLLIEDGIACSYGGFINGMFARIEILDGNRRCGMVDIYNTKKKRLKPDFRGFRDAAAKSAAEDAVCRVLAVY